MERKVAKATLAAVTFVAAALLCGQDAPAASPTPSPTPNPLVKAGTSDDIHKVNGETLKNAMNLSGGDSTRTPPPRADSVGPHRDLRAIERDLPIILASFGQSHIDGIVVKGADAIAQVMIGEDTYAVLRYQFDRWWVVDFGAGFCEGSPLVESPVLDLAQQHLPATFFNGLPAHCTRIFETPTFTQGEQRVAGGGTFVMTLRFAHSDAPSNARLPTLLRAPTEAESWVTRGGNSYFFFSATVQSTQPIHVQAGTTIDVWFPFVLDPAKKYALTIGYTDAPLGPIEGTLKDNTLHFVLPAFSVKPGAHLMGEIEGNPDGP